MWEEEQGDADGDEQGAEEENEADAKQETHGALAFLGGFLGGEDGRGGFAIVQKGAKKCEVRELQNLISCRDCQSKSSPAQMTSSPMIPKSLGTIILRGGLCG